MTGDPIQPHVLGGIIFEPSYMGINSLWDTINKQNRRIDSLEREIERLRRDLQQIRSSQIL